MTILTQKAAGLTGNQLKLIALAAMTCDHIGVQLFPQAVFLRIIGRLAMPIFAYMIAQGCRYTRNRTRYLLTIAATALVCQLVYFFAMGSLYQCILVTFTLSVLLIYALDSLLKKPSVPTAAVAVLALFSARFVSTVLPGLLPGTDFHIDYGFWGILLPAFIYFGREKWQSLLLCAAGLILLSRGNSIQWYSLLALPLLALYNGTRGKANLKYLFYIYYPAHLVVIYLLGLLF